MYITRSEAIEALREFEGIGILREDLMDRIEDIILILTHEDEDRLSLWGAENAAVDLFVAKREDLIDEAWVNHCKELYEKYRIK